MAILNVKIGLRGQCLAQILTHKLCEVCGAFQALQACMSPCQGCTACETACSLLAAGRELGVRGCCDCRLLALGQDPLQAVSGARLHHQLLPDLVRAEHWNVSSVTGPSFMVTHAEVEVYSTCSTALLCSTFATRTCKCCCFLIKVFHQLLIWHLVQSANCIGCNESATTGLALAAQASC